MKTIFHSQCRICPIGDIKVNECFLHDEKLYLRTTGKYRNDRQQIAVVCLQDADEYWFLNDQDLIVQPVEAEVAFHELIEIGKAP